MMRGVPWAIGKQDAEAAPARAIDPTASAEPDNLENHRIPIFILPA